MENANIEAGLRQLAECLRQIKSLLAWTDLVKAEARPGRPPSFRLDHDIQDDLRQESGIFLSTSMDLHEVLNRDRQKSVLRPERERWKRRLLRLQEEFRKLDINEGFIKP